MPKQIPLSQGLFAIVDDADFDWLNQWKWCARKTNYGGWMAVRKCTCPLVRQRRWIRMHRQIMSTPNHLDTDHRFHNTLDNRRENLRICSRVQNLGNRKRALYSSRYQGVSWRPSLRKWRAQIQENGRRKHLGYFQTEQDAARAYDRAAKQIFGEFAYLNFAIEPVQADTLIA